MDNSKFDRILKEKLEQHEGHATPSGQEMARLVDDLPTLHAGNSVRHLNRLFLISTIIMFIAIIFLIFRTYRLQTDVLQLSAALENSAGRQLIVSDPYAGILADSLQSLLVLVDSQESKLDGLEASLASIQSLLKAESSGGGMVSSRYELEEQAAMLTDSLERNRELISTLLADASPASPSPADTAASASEPEMELLLFELLNPETQRVIIVDRFEEEGLTADWLAAIMAQAANAGKRLKFTPQHPGDAAEIQALNNGKVSGLTTEDQKALADMFLRQDPIAMMEAGKQVGADGELQDLLHAYAEANPGEETPPGPAVQAAGEVSDLREKQKKMNNSSWWMGVGAGYGMVQTNEFSNAQIIPIKVFAEYKPNDRLGFSIGALYYAGSQGQDYIDPATEQEIEERMNWKWLDIPLEGRYYLLPDRTWNPYLTASLRARFLVEEKYTIKSYGQDALLPTFEQGKSFAFPHAGFGFGARLRFRSKFNIASQLQYSIGGAELGGYNDTFNSLQGHIYLMYRID
jgi:hypothetical protein